MQVLQFATSLFSSPHRGRDEDGKERKGSLLGEKMNDEDPEGDEGEEEEEEEEEGVVDDEDDEGEGSDEAKDGNEVEVDEGSADASSRASPEPEPTVAKLRGPASKRAPQAKKASTTTTKAVARPTRGSTQAETEDETKKKPPARPVKPVKQTYMNRKRPTRKAGAESDDDEGDDMDELALQGDETDYDEDAVLKEVRREEPESEADSGTESGSESESDEEPELATPPSAKVLKELNDDLKSQRFPSLLLSSGIKLKIGDPIELTSGEKEPWLGKVVQIRTLKSGLTNVLNEKGDPLKNSRGKPALQSKESYVQIHWLYTKKMFESDVQDKSRITKTINSLGDYERVETSHADWYSQSKIKSIDEAVVVYRFDDTFPAQNPDHPDQQADHALTQFRKPKLDDNLPLFFFGDEGPGSDQTPYVRTGFDFDPDVDEEEKEEEAVVEPAQKKGKGRKRRASTSASASKANKKARLPRGPPLRLKLHSITCKPYNPRNVQIFSTEGYGGWYDVDDLIAYGKVAPLSRSVGLARLDQEVFSDDDDNDNDNDNDENEDEDQAEGSHGRTPTPNKKGREVVREMKPFKLPALPTPEKPKRGVKPTIDQDAAMLKWILGKGPMMRGGAYGLIGNSVILHRAQALVDRFEKTPLNGPKLWQQEAHKAIVAFDEWDRCVQIRSKVKGKPWARLGLPPQGMCWTSPVSETPLV